MTRLKIIDNAVPIGLVHAAIATWPDARWPHWHRYSQHGAKYATKDADRLTAACRMLIDRLCGFHPAELLGCDYCGMFPDLDLHGAGMHWIPAGGHLDRHLDSAAHPLTGWRRRASVVLYLESCEGGALVIGERSIEPSPGRLVCFETHDDAWHAVEPVRSGNRRSLSLFWWDCEPAGSRERAVFA